MRVSGKAETHKTAVSLDMGGTDVIERFVEVFNRYIDSGFGLIQGEVAFIATMLIVIDVTLAAPFCSMGEGDDNFSHRHVGRTTGQFAANCREYRFLAA